MTNQNTTSRRDLLKGSGFLAVGFCLGLPITAASAAERRGGRGGNIDAWIRINADGTVTVLTGKMELGQGIKTALAQIAAEELDVSMERMRVVIADTEQTADEGYTAASVSVESSGSSIRQAAAETRQILLQLAGEKLAAAPDQLDVTDGVITRRGGDQRISYWELLGDQRIQRQVTGQAPLKRPEQYRVVGKSAGRLDIPDIASGKAVYVQDLRLPGMVHARVVRPPTYEAVLREVDEEAVKEVAGVIRIVREGNFLAVVAQREEQAVWAAEILRQTATWEQADSLPKYEELYEHLRRNAGERRPVQQGGDLNAGWAAAAVRVEAAYFRPYHMHGSLGPSCAVAQFKEGQLTVWSHTQGPFPLKRTLCAMFNLPQDKVRVIGVVGSGCYGHNGADDVGADAALIARWAEGRPVRVQWSRADEHTWEPYGPGMIMTLRGGLDGTGRIVAWEYDLISDGHGARPGGNADAVLAHRHRSGMKGLPGAGGVGGGTRNSEPLYNFSNGRIMAAGTRRVLRTSSLRGLGAYANVFAIECFMDELAAAARIDPVAMRLGHLADERAKAVIQAVAQAVSWERRDKLPVNHGLGIGFARYKNYATYCAVVAEVAVDPVSREIRLIKLTAAADAGQVINPDGLANQIEGGMIQSASWTLKEQVKFDARRVTCRDWEDYPILRYDQSPATQVIVLNRPGERAVGAGEASMGPTGAAIANAVFAASGKRLRTLPLGPVAAAAGDPSIARDADVAPR